MITELKLLRIVCDQCGATENYQSTVTYMPPDGWTRTRIGPCGMTDYYRDGHLCPTCSTAAARSRGADETEDGE